MLKILNLMFCIHLQKYSFILQFAVWTSRGKKMKLATWSRGRVKRHLTLLEILSWGLPKRLKMHVICHIISSWHSPFLFSKLYVFMTFSDSYWTAKSLQSFILPSTELHMYIQLILLYHTHLGIFGHDIKYDKPQKND